MVIDLFLPYLAPLGKSLLLTLTFFGLGAAGSLLLGLPVAAAMAARSRALRWTAVGYVELFRNTPLIVQLFWIHFALPGLTGVRLSVEQTGGIAIVLVLTAYMAEIYRGALSGVARGQREAASALGLSPLQTWALVLLPQALAAAMPAIGNMMVSLLKATAILSMLGVPEFMRMTGRISDYSARPVEFYTAAVVVYILAGLALGWAFRRLEIRMNRWRQA